MSPPNHRPSWRQGPRRGHLQVMMLLLVMGSVMIWLQLSVQNTHSSSCSPDKMKQVDNSPHHDPTIQTCKRRRPAIFDPFNDIRYETIQPQKLEDGLDSFNIFSSFSCVSEGSQKSSRQNMLDGDKQNVDNDGQDFPLFVSRTCRYSNLYYHVPNRTFVYLLSPDIDLQQQPQPPEISMNTVPAQLQAHEFPKMGIMPWTPKIVTSLSIPDATSVVSVPNNLVFLLFRPFHSMNVGHLVWDDFLTQFQLMEFFLLTNDDDHQRRRNSYQPLPLFVEQKRNEWVGKTVDPQFRCNPANIEKWIKCVNTYLRMYPSMMRIQPDNCTGDIFRTGNWFRQDQLGFWSTGNSNDSDISSGGRGCMRASTSTRSTVKPEWVRIPNAVAGIGRFGMFSCHENCALHTGYQMKQFRDRLLFNLLGKVPNSVGSSEMSYDECADHLVRRENKGYITFSIPAGSSRPNLVTNFEKEIPIARQRYGSERVKVVDFAQLSIESQAELISNTAVLFTNHGGGSFVSLFLPSGATAFVYYHKKYKFDESFYESSTPWFDTIWIAKEERNRYFNRTIGLLERACQVYDRKASFESDG